MSRMMRVYEDLLLQIKKEVGKGYFISSDISHLPGIPEDHRKRAGLMKTLRLNGLLNHIKSSKAKELGLPLYYNKSPYWQLSPLGYQAAIEAEKRYAAEVVAVGTA